MSILGFCLGLLLLMALPLVVSILLPALIGLVGLLSLFFMAEVYSAAWAELAIHYFTDQPCYCSEDPNYVSAYQVQHDQAAIRRELRWRSITPPGLSACFSDQATVCELTDKMLHNPILRVLNVLHYLIFLCAGCVGAATSAILAHDLTTSHQMLPDFKQALRNFLKRELN